MTIKVHTSCALHVHTDLWTRTYHHKIGWVKLIHQSHDKVITNQGRDHIIDIFQGLVAANTMRFHEAGTSNVVEAVTDTQLFGPVLARATGALTENTSATFRSVGTVSFATAFTIREHGLYSTATGATIVDRTVLATAIPVDVNDRIEFTFDLTLASGG